MSEQTKNYGFIKHDKTEFFSVDHINENMDLIDAELKKVSDNDAEKLKIGDDYRPNLLHNGDFQVWQRGTSFDRTSVIGRFYSADRWCSYRGNSVEGMKINKIGKYLEMYNSSDIWCSIGQSLESCTVKAIAGKTVTFSVRIKSNVTNTSSIALYYNDPGELTPGSGATGTVAVKPVVMTTEFNTFSLTAKIPESAQGLLCNFNGADGSAATYVIEWMKLEVNDHVTPFIPRTYGEELRNCQRYGFLIKKVVDYAGHNWGDSTAISISIPLLAPLRISPSLSKTTGGINIRSANGGHLQTGSALSVYSISDNVLTLKATHNINLAVFPASSVCTAYIEEDIFIDAEI